ncbi:NTP transferase domain-containing protein [Halopenitus sp. POP-27]|uniref:cytidylyltransferase domain-containing protein n=1 Tax=Halopenitus sp. POP-27 TaxID=2994425 RepID=UPI002468DC58|nr:NTP transferase domain-containing protein [Halopenitus sp. POP-27]
MDIIVILQVRLGSSRLPGKAMYPLDGDPALIHELRRIVAASRFDPEDVLVATTDRPCDDTVEWVAKKFGATVYRGTENDVLGRIYRAADAAGADGVVRVTADNPLVEPAVLTHLSDLLQNCDVEYVSNKLDGTFPIGLGASAFTLQALQRANDTVSDDYYREHAGAYFRDSLDRLRWEDISAIDIFNETLINDVPNFSSLRLTMDVADDYRLFSQVYNEVQYDYILDAATAINYISDTDLRVVNENVVQDVP